MKNQRILRRSILSVLVVSSMLTAAQLHGATYVWDVNSGVGFDGAQDGGGTWSPGNWFNSTSTQQNQSWVDGNDASFGAGSGAAGTITLSGPVTANSLTFNAAGSGTYALSGSTLTVTTGNIVANVNASISSSLAGSLGLNKSGTGALTLSGGSANTYTGTTIVSAGSLILNKTAGVTSITGDIQVNTGGTLTQSTDNQIADSATLTIGGGAVLLGGRNETIANLTMTSGTFGTGNTGTQISTVNITGTMSVSGGTVTLNSGGTINAQAITLTNGSNIVLGGNQPTQLTVGSGGMSMSGQNITLNIGTVNTQVVLNGDLTASGTNNFSLNGTASTGLNSLAIGTAARTLNITGGTTSINLVVTGSSGSLIKSGAGTLTLGGALANTYTGVVTVNAGTLNLQKTAGVNAIAGDVLVNGGTIKLGANNQIADTSNITVTGGTFAANGFSDTFASLLLNGGSFTSSTGTTVVTGATTVTAGGPGMTINSGGAFSTNSLTLTNNAGVLIGGSANNMTTLTVGAGGFFMSGQTLQVNAASSAGNAGTQIILNGDFTGSGTNNFNIVNTPVAGSVDQLVIGSGTHTFNITSGATNMSLAIVGTGNLVKQGAGQLAVLADSTYSGATTVSGGSMALGSTAASITPGKISATTSLTITGGASFQDGSSTASFNDSVNNRINPLATLTLGGTQGSGTFVHAFGTVSSSQTLASLAIQQGANTITSQNTPTGTLSLNFTGTAAGAGYSRSVGGTVNFASASGYSVNFINAPTLAGGSSVSGSGGDALLVGATMDGANFITAQAGALTAATYVDTDTSTWSTGKNMNVTGNVTATSGTPINSLRFATANAYTVSLADTQTISSGMVLVSSAVGNNLTTISGGTLTGSANGDLVLLQYNLANGLSISSTIADNGGATGLTISGGGLVTLSGTNTYTGQTYVNGSTLSIGSNAALGAVGTGATLNMDGATLLATSSFALDNGGANRRNIVIGAGGAIFNTGSGVTLTVSGNVSGNGILQKISAGTLLLSGANTFTAGINMQAGTLQFGSDTAAGTGTVILGGGTIQPTGGNRTLANPITLAASASVNFNFGLTTVSGNSSLTFTGPATMTTPAFTVTNNLTSGNTLTLAGNLFLSTGNATAARQLTFVGSGASVISGVVASNDSGFTPQAGITFNGTGSLKLTGINTYLGRTVTANTGTLIIQQDANLGAAPATSTVDSLMLAQQGTLRVENSFTLNSNRNIGIGSASGLANTGTIDVATGQTFTVNSVVADRTVNSDGTPVSAVNIGTLRKIGSGTLVLGGNNTYSGDTTVSAGNLLVTGSISALTAGTQNVSVATGAALQLGGAGTISATTLSLNNNSTFSLEVGTLTSNTINLSGAASLTGTVTLALNLTADPLDGTTFTLINGSSPLLGYSSGARFSAGGQTLDEGSTFSVTTGGFTQNFKISYLGGTDGNDVTLQALATVPEPNALFTLSSSLGLLVGMKRLRRRSSLRTS